MHRMERRVEQGTATLKDYTVLVTGLPYDATEEEVRCHFALRYGEVARVAVIGTECTRINAQRRRRRLLEDYDEASAALEDLADFEAKHVASSAGDKSKALHDFSVATLNVGAYMLGGWDFNLRQQRPAHEVFFYWPSWLLASWAPRRTTAP